MRVCVCVCVYARVEPRADVGRRLTHELCVEQVDGDSAKVTLLEVLHKLVHERHVCVQLNLACGWAGRRGGGGARGVNAASKEDMKTGRRPIRLSTQKQCSVYLIEGKVEANANALGEEGEGFKKRRKETQKAPH